MRTDSAKKSFILGGLCLTILALLLFGCGGGGGGGGGGRVTKIAFTSFRDGNAEVYVMNADGSNLVNLTNNPADDEFPAWSR